MLWSVRWIWIVVVVMGMWMGSASMALPPPKPVMRLIHNINRHGPYLALVVPNAFEMNPLLHSSSFSPSTHFPLLDFAGRRFHIGSIEGHKVIVVMTGLAMLNAGLSTQLLLSFFKVKGVVHFGIAGNAEPSLHVGDVTIPHYWAHTGLWNWQRYGDDPNDELALEVNGDYTRDIGHLHLASFGPRASDNLLNNVWYQPEEVFPVNSTPEARQHAFWLPVDSNYYKISGKLESLKLESCLNATTCLSHEPKVVQVERGGSANVFVDNAAYRSFIHSKFNISAIDMESAGVGLVCLAQGVPFISIRALSDLAGGGSSESNEASLFAGLAAQNAVTVVIQFIHLLQ
eukprot:Gb_29710 [translate_table: standard]